MVMVGLGLALLALLMWAAGAFARASVTTVKSLLTWVAALGGILLAAMLLLTGRGRAAIGGAVLFGPLLWEQWRKHAGRSTGGGRTMPPHSGGKMSRNEALAVLGLQDPVSEADVREAWRRLMRGAHPDGGGTDWLAAKVNQAKDVLLHR
jgi:DnaJ homolog subfamily C member 19